MDLEEARIELQENNKVIEEVGGLVTHDSVTDPKIHINLVMCF